MHAFLSSLKVCGVGTWVVVVVVVVAVAVAVALSKYIERSAWPGSAQNQ